MWNDAARAVSTVLVFSLLGPIIAASIATMLLAATADSAGHMLGYVALAILLAVSLYVFALGIGVVTGLFFAVVDFGQERSNILLATLVGIAASIASKWVGLPSGTAPLFLTGVYHWRLFLASLGATVGCWLIARSVNDSW